MSGLSNSILYGFYNLIWSNFLLGFNCKVFILFAIDIVRRYALFFYYRDKSTYEKNDFKRSEKNENKRRNRENVPCSSTLFKKNIV